jgi:acyl transferase domain-containing protein
MAAIAAAEDVVARYITEMGLQQQLSIAVYNAADSNVVSGDLKAIEKLMAAVKRDGMRATKLAVAQGESISYPGL